MYVATVPEQAQAFLIFAVGRLQHQHHDTQVGVHIGAVERVALFHNAHAASRGAVQRLAIRVLPVV